MPFKRKSYLLKANSYTKPGFTEEDNALQCLADDVTYWNSHLILTNREEAWVRGKEAFFLPAHLGHDVHELTASKLWLFHFAPRCIPFLDKAVTYQEITLFTFFQWSKKENISTYIACFAIQPHSSLRVYTMRLSLGKVIGLRLQWQGFLLRDEYTMGPWGACWKRVFSLKVDPCGNSISKVVGGPQLGLSEGV